MIDRNVVVLTNNFERNKDLLPVLFPEDEAILFIDTTVDMFHLLVQVGIFQSIKEAKNNWKRTGKEIPYGFSDFRDIGKMKNRVTIWKPI